MPKPKWRPQTPSDWVEDSKDNMDGFEMLESCLGQGIALRKHIATIEHPKPNPAFYYTYDPSKDKQELDRCLKINHLSVTLQDCVRLFVIENWDVFREEGIKIPVQGYEMVIDTGDHKPVVIPLPCYGMFESPVMQKTIDRLLELGHIQLDTTSPWGSRITLAPKPHQENITDIEDYIWRFCNNYILLNRITQCSEYPIPRCNDAVMYGFGIATLFLL